MSIFCLFYCSLLLTLRNKGRFCVITWILFSVNGFHLEISLNCHLCWFSFWNCDDLPPLVVLLPSVLNLTLQHTRTIIFADLKTPIRILIQAALFSIRFRFWYSQSMNLTVHNRYERLRESIETKWLLPCWPIFNLQIHWNSLNR